MAQPPTPGPCYLDSSVLVKLYLPEPHSDEVNAAVRGRRDLMISDLAITEVVSAIARARREGLISSEDAARVHALILQQVDTGMVQRIDLAPHTHRTAEQFLLAIDSVPLRAADALHLALAVTAGAASLLTFDRRLAAAAWTIGLPTGF